MSTALLPFAWGKVVWSQAQLLAQSQPPVAARTGLVLLRSGQKTFWICLSLPDCGFLLGIRTDMTYLLCRLPNHTSP